MTDREQTRRNAQMLGNELRVVARGLPSSLNAREADRFAAVVDALLVELDARRPLTEPEWQFIQRGNDVIYAARTLCKSSGEINSLRSLEQALSRYDEAWSAR